MVWSALSRSGGAGNGALLRSSSICSWCTLTYLAPYQKSTGSPVHNILVLRSWMAFPPDVRAAMYGPECTTDTWKTSIALPMTVMHA
ncbi:hypothetical protein FA95DRAFT_1229867 [Auriscalpium vulgare]|uniref:Uncharacterized protein n=1 Tax=Auriscalpium vulgare TaxID=40419 RepID=A0ACB8R396_9AGAM|nr:hypothetical protein FA95DRAFT_1229867 [Auriscalpium vulgare]